MSRINLNHYDNIIFDFGGVIIDLDLDSIPLAFSRFSKLPLELIKSWSKNYQLFSIFETGIISADQFRNKIRDDFQIHASDEEFDCAWDQILLNIPSKRLELIQKIGETKNTFLLSNTNEIHEKKFQEKVFSSVGKKLEDFFDGVYLSHQIGYRKPDPFAFHHIVKTHQLLPKRTLFIDDSQIFVNGAIQYGIEGRHLKIEEEDLCDLFFI